VANVSSKLRATSLEDQTLEAMWGHYKSALNFDYVIGKLPDQTEVQIRTRIRPDSKMY